jgi:SAM-dependent methyltransferase
MYSTTSFEKKVRWFVNRFGAKEIVLKPMRSLFGPIVIPMLRRRTFDFNGCRLELFAHRYNQAWATERAVEIPIAKWYLDQYKGREVLEVGNVVSHYEAWRPNGHIVVDKFEKGPGVVNVDVLDFHPATRFDLILSISTFEHIGFDEECNEPSGRKIVKAMEACLSLLNPGGKLVITVPLGYNPDLDGMIRHGLGASRESYLCRKGFRSWCVCDRESALGRAYGKPFPYGNAILVGEFSFGWSAPARGTPGSKEP